MKFGPVLFIATFVLARAQNSAFEKGDNGPLPCSKIRATHQKGDKSAGVPTGQKRPATCYTPVTKSTALWSDRD